MRYRNYLKSDVLDKGIALGAISGAIGSLPLAWYLGGEVAQYFEITNPIAKFGMRVVAEGVVFAPSVGLGMVAGAIGVPFVAYTTGVAYEKASSVLQSSKKLLQKVRRSNKDNSDVNPK